MSILYFFSAGYILDVQKDQRRSPENIPRGCQSSGEIRRWWNLRSLRRKAVARWVRLTQTRRRGGVQKLHWFLRNVKATSTWCFIMVSWFFLESFVWFVWWSVLFVFNDLFRNHGWSMLIWEKLWYGCMILPLLWYTSAVAVVSLTLDIGSPDMQQKHLWKSTSQLQLILESEDCTPTHTHTCSQIHNVCVCVS